MGKKEGGKPKNPRKGKTFTLCNITFRIDWWREFGSCLMVQEADGTWRDAAWADNITTDLRKLALSIARVERELRDHGEK